MSHVAYPSSLPVDCATTIISIVRSRQIVEKKTDFAHCLWNVQGYAQKALIGEPSDQSTLFGANEEIESASDAQCEEMANCIVEAEKQCREVKSPQASVSAASAPVGVQAQFDPTLLLTIIPIVIDLLRKLGWIKNRQ